MRKLLIIIATLMTSLSMNAATNMTVKKKDGKIVLIRLDDVTKVSFEADSSILYASETPLKFEILSDTEVGIIEDDSYRNLTTIEIPEKVKIDGVVYNVTTIKSWAFSHCRSLTNITIPESISSIEIGAFSGCNNLELGLLIYNNGTKCYGWVGNEYECTSVVIPEGVKEIGDQAFYKMFFNMTSITLPESLESIGEMAFGACSSLTELTLPSNLKKIGGEAFWGCDNLNLTINASESDVKVGKSAISDCKSVLWVKDAMPLEFTILSDSTVEVANTNKSVVSVVIPASVIIDGKTYSVTRIADNGFYNTSSLIRVIIPNSVTSIGEWAFGNCYKLSEFSIPESVETIEKGSFYGCGALKNVTIPKSVRNIQENAFSRCYSANILIDNSAENLYVYKAFDNVNSVKYAIGDQVIDDYELNILFGPLSDSTAKVIEVQNMGDSISIPAKVRVYGKVQTITTIEYLAFSNLKNLVKVTLPNTITDIESYAFRGCSSLTSITIPSSVKTMDVDAFDQCDKMSVIEVDPENQNFSSVDGVLYDKDKTKILYIPQALKGEITLPENLISFPKKLFSSIKGLTFVNVAADNKNYASIDGIVYDKEITKIIFVSPEVKGDVIIAEGVDSIEEKTFYNFVNLTSITLPNTLKAIGPSAFQECKGLVSVNIPESVTSIGALAFYNCISLADLTIPSQITTIGGSTFYKCESLTDLTLSENVTTIGNGAFFKCSNLDLKIDNSEENIKFVNWSDQEVGMEESYALEDVKSVTWLK